MALVNRIIVLVLLLGIVAAAVLAATEFVLAGLNQPPLLASPNEVEGMIHQATWQNPTVQFVTAVAGLAGLLLVLAQLKPRRPDTVATEPLAEGRDIVLDRHGMEAELERRVVAHDDIVAAHVRWRRFRLRVRCDVYPEVERRTAGQQVKQLVKDELDRQGVRRPPRVIVSTRRSEERVR